MGKKTKVTNVTRVEQRASTPSGKWYAALVDSEDRTSASFYPVASWVVEDDGEGVRRVLPFIMIHGEAGLVSAGGQDGFLGLMGPDADPVEALNFAEMAKQQAKEEDEAERSKAVRQGLPDPDVDPFNELQTIIFCARRIAAYEEARRALVAKAAERDEAVTWRQHAALGDYKNFREAVEAVMALLAGLDGVSTALDNTYGALLRVLMVHVGETGDSEGAVDVLRRLVGDSMTLRGFQKGQAAQQADESAAFEVEMLKVAVVSPAPLAVEHDPVCLDGASEKSEIPY